MTDMAHSLMCCTQDPCQSVGEARFLPSVRFSAARFLIDTAEMYQNSAAWSSAFRRGCSTFSRHIRMYLHPDIQISQALK